MIFNTMGPRTLIIFSISALAFAAPSTDFDLDSLGKSSNIFAADLYKVLAQEPGNLLISPASLQTNLALVLQGANGQTLNEIARALGLPASKPSVQKAFKDLLPVLRNVQHSTLSSANKVYVKDGFDINPNFTEIAAESFDAQIEAKDFLKKEETVHDINEWVENKTNNKIKNLIREDDITERTQMVLINALYFQGNWETPFDKDFTQKRKFFINDTHFATVDMMHAEHTANYSEDATLDATFLELPYSGQEFTMTFVLPNKKDGLPSLEANLHKVLEPRKMQEKDVYIVIPKFKVEKDIKLVEPLKELGMIEAFREDADLSDFSLTKKDLYISKILQKTFIDVNEKGTEAAAATASLIDERFSGSEKKFFLADRPFLFVLHHTSSDIALFVGRYSTPTDTTKEVEAE